MGQMAYTVVNAEQAVRLGIDRVKQRWWSRQPLDILVAEN
jgi:hypothetical protein